MRVHRLEVTAFGPFAGTETLDFEHLNDAGIFLLTGQTGAGKTSVLDAISFALFGSVPGARNRTREFKSHHAPGETPPSVTLEVTLRGRRFRIRRSPAWRRPSTRARAGYVDEHARVTVEEHVAAAWQPRATRLDEAGLLLRRVLGMTQEQFCQVVLLPQGQFETFLRADAKDRHDLLESLFETGRFGQVETWLADHRRRTGAAWARARREIDGLLARAAEVADSTSVEPGSAAAAAAQPADRDASSLDIDAETRRLLGRRDLVANEAATAQARSAAARESAKAARHELDEATGLAERQERHRTARRRLDELVTLQPAVDQRRRRVQRAQAAAELRPLLDLLDESAAELGMADQEAHSALTLVSDIAASEVGTAGGDGCEAALHEMRALRTRLYESLPVEAEAAALSRRGDHQAAALAGASAELDDLAATASRLPRLRAQLDEEITRTRVAALGRAAASDLHEHAQARLAAAEELARLTPELMAARTKHLEARERCVAVRESVHRLRERRLSGIAAELAAALAEGHACPVCGSTSHPALAEAAGGLVDASDEEAAEAELRQSEAARDRAATDLAELAAAAARAEAAAGGDTCEGATEAVSVAAETLHAATTAETHLVILGQRADELTADESRVAGRTLELRATVAALTERRGATMTRLDDVRLQLAPLLQGHSTLADRLRLLDDGLHRLEVAAAAVARRQRAAEDHDQHRGRLDASLRASIFDDVAEPREALVHKAELSTLESLNRRFADDLAALRRDVDDPGLRAAAAHPAPDLESLRRTAEAAEAARADAHARHAALTQRFERLAALLDELARAHHRATPLRSELDLAERVAAMCAGNSQDNQHKTRLSHYVVAARLEQVVDAANVRLRSVGGGRYQLEHSLARAAGVSRGGLSLVVLDTYTDLRRDPSTLSGGETFYVSLALALGLADLVSGEAGGAQLSTLFVDEGFGALDGETLDEVMDEIDQLRIGGRSVGLVSHLTELRMRVPTQVRIERGRHGSHILATDGA